MSYHFPLVVFTLMLLFLTSAFSRVEAFELDVESGERKVAVLELYTSEGCNSCPPADEFVSRLGRAGWYPERLLPLSFHVTYWNYIGWRDPFSQAQFDDRQRDAAKRQRSRTVYTPQLLLDGRDLRGVGRFGGRLNTLNAEQPRAHIRLKAQGGMREPVQLELEVEVHDKSLLDRSGLYVVLYESGLSNAVDAGENEGKTLHHDYVVRKLIGPLALSADAVPSRHALAMEMPAALVERNAGIAAFVQNHDDGSVLQAVAAPLVSP